MKDSAKTILEKVEELNNKKRSEIQNLENKINEISGKIAELNISQEAAASQLNYEEAYQYKREINRLEEERSYYRDGIATIEQGRTVDSGTFEKYSRALTEEYYKAEAEYRKRVSALINDLEKATEEHAATCNRLEVADIQLREAAGESSGPSLVSQHTGFMRQIIERVRQNKVTEV